MLNVTQLLLRKTGIKVLLSYCYDSTSVAQTVQAASALAIRDYRFLQTTSDDVMISTNRPMKYYCRLFFIVESHFGYSKKYFSLISFICLFSLDWFISKCILFIFTSW